jgi:hypothetical protein
MKNKKFDPEKAFKILMNDLPKKVSFIDFDKYNIVTCIPSRYYPVQPDDQSPCIIEDCPSCGLGMYVSEKKIKLRNMNDRIKTYCTICLCINAQIQNIELEMTDIGKTIK